MLSCGRTLLTSVALSVLATSVALGGSTVASADPSTPPAHAVAAGADQSVEAAQRELARLHGVLEDLEENFAQASFAQKAAQQRADALAADVAAQQAKVDTLRRQAAGIARASFQSGGVDTTTQLFVSGDPDSFLQQISTVAKVDENMNSVLQSFQAEQANLADLKRAAEAELAKAREATKKAATLEAEGRSNVAATKAVVARLSADQRRALEAAQAAAARTAEAAAANTSEAAPAASGGSAGATSGGDSFGSGAPASSAAAKAVAYARAHLGDSYSWAAEGPNSFDCSGLIVAAYRSAGVSLPHSSLSLSGMGASVSRSQLKPGDLIFWYSPVHHVAIYDGNGMMIHAQNPRVGVVRTPVNQWLGYGIYYAGAKRVG